MWRLTLPESCTPESIFRKNHVTTFMTSFIDPIYEVYPQCGFPADPMLANLNVSINK